VNCVCRNFHICSFLLLLFAVFVGMYNKLNIDIHISSNVLLYFRIKISINVNVCNYETESLLQCDHLACTRCKGFDYALSSMRVEAPTKHAVVNCRQTISPMQPPGEYERAIPPFAKLLWSLLYLCHQSAMPEALLLSEWYRRQYCFQLVFFSVSTLTCKLLHSAR